MEFSGVRKTMPRHSQTGRRRGVAEVDYVSNRAARLSCRLNRKTLSRVVGEGRARMARPARAPHRATKDTKPSHEFGQSSLERPLGAVNTAPTRLTSSAKLAGLGQTF
jgi:hypothetical protein